MNGAPRKRSRLERQHAMRGFIGHQYPPVRIGSDDRGRAAFDQHFQLFFGIAARIPLPFNLVEVLDDDLAVPVYLVDEEADAEEGDKIEDVARHSCSEVPD